MYFDMKIFNLSIILSVCFCGTLFAQKDVSVQYANTITTSDLREHLDILASDALEGRETGTQGQKMAAAYIEYQFKANGLEPIVKTPSGNSYIQSFDLVKTNTATSWIKIDDLTYNNTIDFIYFGNDNFEEPVMSNLLFVGEGNAEDYNAIPAQGKNVLIYCIGDRAERKDKAALAKKFGAKNVFMMKSGSEEDFKTLITMHNRYTSNGRLTFEENTDETVDYFLISPSMGEVILKTSQKTIKSEVEKAKTGKYASIINLRSKEVTFYTRQDIEKIGSENVLGFVEGKDKKNEYIIVTAHFDHLGKDGEEVFNGADDDGSGTVAILEMAQAFALAQKEGNGPRRSMLFMTVTGEEKGLLGSTYYVTHPALPLEKTITNLNIDMIGRVDKNHTDTPDYIYLIGSDKLSKDLHFLSEKTNATYTQLELDYTYNATNDPNRFYYRSDHYNFAKNNIPVIFYFNGTHDDYHQPTDTVDKINFDLLEKRTKLVFHTAWEIANREDRITVDVKPEEIELDISK